MSCGMTMGQSLLLPSAVDVYSVQSYEIGSQLRTGFHFQTKSEASLGHHQAEGSSITEAMKEITGIFVEV